MERDWTYIDDVVAAVAAAVQRPMGYEVINHGLGAPIPLNDFIEGIESLAGRKLIRVDTPAPASDPSITFSANAKALINDDPRGFVKILSDPATGVVLGGSIVGRNAAELISVVALAVTAGLRVNDIVESLLVHPALAEALADAAE